MDNENQDCEIEVFRQENLVYFMRKKQKNQIIMIVLMVGIFLIAINMIGVFAGKYIFIGGDWVNYQALVNLNTENSGTLVQPNLSELMIFIANDGTNNHTYSQSYKCTDFSLDLIHNASIAGWQSGLCLLQYVDQTTGHAIVVFNTTDYDLIYIEGQNDINISEYIHIMGTYQTHTINLIAVYFNQ